jgi:DNA-binding ferritin-like protein (Dps family)
MCFGPGDGGTAASMFEDLAELFEQSAASGTPIRAIVGEDPVEFAETFLRNYPEGSWIVRERNRLTSAVERAAAEDAGPKNGTGTNTEGTTR